MQGAPKAPLPALKVQMSWAQVQTEMLHLSESEAAVSCAVHSKEMEIKVLCKSNNFE